MKKLACLLIAVLLAAMTIVPALAGTMYVKTWDKDKVNMRKGPDVEYPLVDRVPYATAVNVLSSENGWSYVELHGHKGYIMSRYLSNTKPSDQPAPTPTPKPKKKATNYSSFKVVEPYNVTVKASRPGGYVNLRWAPNKSVAVIKKVYDGAQLTVICEGKDWYQVQDPTTHYVGFVLSSYLKK